MYTVNQGVCSINTDYLSIGGYVCICTSQMPIVTCHSNKIICYKEDGSVEGFGPAWEQSPHVGPDVGWPYQGHIQRILGNLLLRPPPLCPSLTLSRQLPSQNNWEADSVYYVNGPRCGLYEYLMISFAFPEKELREDFSVIGTSSGQQGCGWHGADWLVTSPPGASPKLKTPTDGSRLRVWQRGETVGGFRQRSGAVERTRTCWSSLRWPWHAVRGKPETHFPLQRVWLTQLPQSIHRW